MKKDFLKILKITDKRNPASASTSDIMKEKLQGSKSISTHPMQSYNTNSSSNNKSTSPPNPPGEQQNNTSNHNNSSSTPSSLLELSIDWIYPRLKRPSAFWHFASVITIAAVGIFSKLILGMFLFLFFHLCLPFLVFLSYFVFLRFRLYDCCCFVCFA